MWVQTKLDKKYLGKMGLETVDRMCTLFKIYGGHLWFTCKYHHISYKGLVYGAACGYCYVIYSHSLTLWFLSYRIRILLFSLLVHNRLSDEGSIVMWLPDPEGSWAALTFCPPVLAGLLCMAGLCCSLLCLATFPTSCCTLCCHLQISVQLTVQNQFFGLFLILN